ncbi:Ankyrin repeat [Musa troglodytarum]|uniref:Ankyrin repeat n=1 Tax=Musa troglodytarum TaxID=320322 RepID=A0A9E7HLR7_9LILI|nr:Ankyrin repeat [Musa troglodytarum]
MDRNGRLPRHWVRGKAPSWHPSGIGGDRLGSWIIPCATLSVISFVSSVAKNVVRLWRIKKGGSAAAHLLLYIFLPPFHLFCFVC